MSDPKQTALKAKITRLRNQSKGRPDLTLAEKLALKEKVKDAEQELRKYRLSLASEKAHQKALPKLKRQVTKALDNAAREIAREQVRAACKKPPAEFQSWGHTRTMAWLKLAQQGNRLVKRLRPNIKELQDALYWLGYLPTASLDTCQNILTPKKAK